MRSLWLTVLMLGALVLPGSGAAAEPPSEPAGFEQQVGAEQVRLGEPFVVQMRLRHPLELRYELLTRDAMGDFEVLSLDRQRQDSPDGAVTTFRLTLSAFALGEQALPERTFEVTGPAGKGTFSAPGLSINVVESQPESADGGQRFRDFKPPEDVLVRSWDLLWWLAGLAALALLAFFVMRALRQHRARTSAPPLPAPLDVRTLDALAALWREELPKQGRAREFYFRLSELVRGYLGERYRFEALECTSAELVERLGRLEEPGLPKDALVDFIRRSDFIKFARADASPQTCEQDLDFAVHLVRTTFFSSPPSPPEVKDVR